MDPVVPEIRNIRFGDHAFPADVASVEKARAIFLVVQQIFVAEIATTGGICVLSLFSIIVLPSTPVLLLMFGGVGATAVLATITYWQYRGEALAFYGIVPFAEEDPNGDSPHLHKGFALVDTIESYEWKQRLIQNANESIILSGNYCGGKCFDQILNLISDRMEQAARLKVVILTSPLFITDENQQGIDFLQTKYPDRFELILCRDICYVNPSIKKTTNHVKALVIDGGRHFILGGSGIEDKYAFHNGLQPAGRAKPAPTGRDDSDSTSPVGILERFLPRGFRDMDFLFHSVTPNGGKMLYRQMLRLAFRWEGIDYVVSKAVEDHDPQGFLQASTVVRTLLDETDFERVDPSICDTEEWERQYEDEYLKKDALCHRLSPSSSGLVVDEPISQVLTNVQSDAPSSLLSAPSGACALTSPLFALRPGRVTSRIQFFYTGPECIENRYEEAIIKDLTCCKVNRIFICHMFFHPSEKVMAALVDAVKNGSKLVICTNGNGKGSPKSHKLFGDRNRYHYIELLQRVGKQHRKRVHIYEFKIKKTTLHKKVMVIGNTVFAGNGNLGYKSLETMSDHEVNFRIVSSRLAKEVCDILKVDCLHRVHAEKVLGDPHLTIKQRLAALRHKVLAPLIG
jgi:phosphatidylserine/phosphatidylglycerophosphate/cardiolipin synthase-like enzyme